MHRPLTRTGTMRTYTSRAPPAHGSRRVLSSRRLTWRSSVTWCAWPCTRTLQPSRRASSRWSTSKLTGASAYTASSVSGAVRNTMVFPVTAKLTGSIMIPSADANPTRPTPPGSSRSKHSAGLSVRRACRGAARPGPQGSRSATVPGAPWLLAGPFGVVMFTSASRGMSRLFSLAGAASARCGPTSPISGTFGPGQHAGMPGWQHGRCRSYSATGRPASRHAGERAPQRRGRGCRHRRRAGRGV
jgi:hypothetical protein